MAIIELKGVSKTFSTDRQDVHAVRNVSLAVEAGESCGIVGYSGAGKSTLVRLINLLERPDQGQVIVRGQDLTQLSDQDLRTARRSIGMIFQHFNLMQARDVWHNVAYPLRHSELSKPEISQRVAELLDLVGIPEKAASYPSELSGGQQQRVAIARALANDPDILLCDEATSALDPQTTQSILKLLQELQHKLGLTVVIITHEMAVVKQVCTRVAIMDDGRVIEQGPVYEIFANPTETITREFISSGSTLQQVEELIDEHAPIVRVTPPEKLVKLTYNNESADEALVSEASRRYQVDVSIIAAQVEVIQGLPLGSLVARVSGNASRVDEAIAYFASCGVKVEELSNGLV